MLKKKPWQRATNRAGSQSARTERCGLTWGVWRARPSHQSAVSSTDIFLAYVTAFVVRFQVQSRSLGVLCRLCFLVREYWTLLITKSMQPRVQLKKKKKVKTIKSGSRFSEKLPKDTVLEMGTSVISQREPNPLFKYCENYFSDTIYQYKIYVLFFFLNRYFVDQPLFLHKNLDIACWALWSKKKGHAMKVGRLYIVIVDKPNTKLQIVDMATNTRILIQVVLSP